MIFTDVIFDGAQHKSCKRFFIFLIAAFFSSSSIVSVHAAYNDATFASTTVTLSGFNLIVTGQVQALINKTSTLDVVLAPGSFLTVISPDKKDFSVGVVGDSTFTKSCNTTDSSIVFTTPSVVSTSTISIIGNCSGSSIPAQVGSLTVVPGNTSGFVSWTAPSDGGSAITDYLVEYKLSGAPIYTLFVDGISASPSVTITGLTNGSSYDVRVSAVNAVGIGSTSTSATFTPVSGVSVPSAPRNVVAVAGNGYATVSFDAPLSSGGSSITSYTVTSSPGGYTASGVGSPLMVTGLSGTQSYTFTVVAINAIGTGAVSSASNSITPVVTTTSSGGGGGGYFSPTSPAPTTPSTPLVTQVQPVTTQTQTSTLGVTEYIPPTVPLKRGVKGKYVVALQNILATKGYLQFAPTDVPGLYGLKTEAGIKQLQCDYKIICNGTPLTTGWGAVGKKTAALINNLNSTTILPSSKPEQISQGVNISTDSPLSESIIYGKGARGLGVRDLQQILVREKLLVLASTDVPGLYGEKTIAAVQKFQCLNNIICSGSPSTTGWGAVDKSTLLALNKIR